MKALSILDEVVRELEQDVNLSRIKKIIFFENIFKAALYY